MKNLFRYLSPFSPDNSGAVSVLYELGGLIVICDAGGCTGNVCGFDEPRWTDPAKRSAIFSAGLRDMDAVMGRDDRLIRKIGGALEEREARFAALIGTPVPSVIATDYRAVCSRLESAFGIPALYIETTGMETYERGEIKAYQAILNCIEQGKADIRSGISSPAARLVQDCQSRQDMESFAGIWGATPLELPALDEASALRAAGLSDQECPSVPAVTYGMDSGLDAMVRADRALFNVALSPSGLIVARALEKKYGIPFRAEYPKDSPALRKTASVIAAGLKGRKTLKSNGGGHPAKILIIHQQIYGNGLREAVEELCTGVEADVASFFQMDQVLARENDIFLEGENDLIRLVRERGYDLAVGDPLFDRALKMGPGRFIPAPHYAVSGELYMKEKQNRQ